MCLASCPGPGNALGRRTHTLLASDELKGSGIWLSASSLAAAWERPWREHQHIVFFKLSVACNFRVSVSDLTFEKAPSNLICECARRAKKSTFDNSQAGVLWSHGRSDWAQSAPPETGGLVTPCLWWPYGGGPQPPTQAWHEGCTSALYTCAMLWRGLSCSTHSALASCVGAGAGS